MQHCCDSSRNNLREKTNGVHQTTRNKKKKWGHLKHIPQWQKRVKVSNQYNLNIQPINPNQFIVQICYAWYKLGYG